MTSPSKLNTHHYDGQLQTRYQQLVQQTQVPELADVLPAIRQLINQDNSLNVKQKHLARQMLQKLAGPTGNWDDQNQIHVHQLLPLVWVQVQTYDQSGQRLFLEQLLDIDRGSCPQGRTTRLLQLATN